MNRTELRVLLDGWQLIYDPLSPSAFHLLELLETLCADAELILALPSERPDWLPSKMAAIELFRPFSAFHHLRWMQFDLPRLAAQVQAKIIHSVQASAPLFASQALIYSPTEGIARRENKRRSVWERVDEALSLGGLSRATWIDRDRIFVEQNMSEGEVVPIDTRMEETSSGRRGESHSLPSAPYFLYQSLGDWERLRFLLQVWSKTAASLGDQAVLAIVCRSEAEQKSIEKNSTPEFLQTLRLYAGIDPPQLMRLLADALAVIQLQDEPVWGGVTQRAMRCGVPVVGFELPSLDKIVGDAGYLVPEGDSRLLSAALLTIAVEEDVLRNLQSKARIRGRRWDREMFRKGMLQVYHRVVERKI
ncbi:MAG: hypothetical protein Kow0088_02260 [Anaerolineales bacterium]